MRSTATSRVKSSMKSEAQVDCGYYLHATDLHLKIGIRKISSTAALYGVQRSVQVKEKQSPFAAVGVPSSPPGDPTSCHNLLRAFMPPEVSRVCRPLTWSCGELSRRKLKPLSSSCCPTIVRPKGPGPPMAVGLAAAALRGQPLHWTQQEGP